MENYIYLNKTGALWVILKEATSSSERFFFAWSYQLSKKTSTWYEEKPSLSIPVQYILKHTVDVQLVVTISVPWITFTLGADCGFHHARVSLSFYRWDTNPYILIVVLEMMVKTVLT